MVASFAVVGGADPPSATSASTPVDVGHPKFDGAKGDAARSRCRSDVDLARAVDGRFGVEMCLSPLEVSRVLRADEGVP